MKRRISKQLDPFIGHLPIESIHMGTLQPFIEARRKQGIKTKSINLALGVVRHILNLAASEWWDRSEVNTPNMYSPTNRCHPITAMNNTAWQKARKRVGLAGTQVGKDHHTLLGGGIAELDRCRKQGV